MMSNYSDHDIDYDEPRFLFLQGVGSYTEEIEHYEEGGFHPVHLGDTFDEGRYKVIQKLGFGGFSTVWLARDGIDNKWVALKIIDAEHSAPDFRSTTHHYTAAVAHGSERVVATSRKFAFEGPNGRHSCAVLPVLGPSLADLSYNFESRLTPSFARNAAYEATRAISELHKDNICLGGKLNFKPGVIFVMFRITNRKNTDFTLGNLLLGAANFDTYSEDDIYKIFGISETGELETESGEATGPEAPKYIVKSMDFRSAPATVLKPGIHLVDFDQSFPISSPPKRMLGIPRDCLAPEVAAGLSASPASDIWALGCCIFRLRAGDGPFSSPYEVNSPETAISYITCTLGGDVPAEWKEKLWDDDGMPTIDAAKGKPLEPWPSEERRSLRDLVNSIWDEPEGRTVHTQHHLKSEWTLSREHEPFPTSWAPMAWNPKAVRADEMYLSGYGDDWEMILASLPKIPEAEAALLYDLLSTIFVYEPEKRPTAEEILAHSYFHMDDDMKN